ncbi:alpha/beta hydrolase [Derxia gummosa]|uniref:Alpha/beta hydrolase n=1 Tax=Derxia gummosa DSM 723 TaxID=1121388 RepID=A0A9U5GKH2_9BURK|nr:alpha/beta hydrolase-fold protein [Derxia gummosa]
MAAPSFAASLALALTALAGPAGAMTAAGDAPVMATGAGPAPAARLADASHRSDRAPADAPVVLPAARQFDLTARANGQRYRIFVAVPDTPAPPAGHPVLYVLDGNAAFPVAAFLARGAARRQDETGLAPPIVVGIGYPDATDFDVAARRRDYTPGPVAPDTVGAPGRPAGADGVARSADAAEAGGADRFLDFIEHELRPLIAARHPVDPARQALFGHSFGGLLVVHALFTRPALFSTWLASSPSIWWDDRRVLRDQPGPDAGRAPARVQISVGALEDDPPPPTLAPELRALIATRQMIPPARELAAGLRALPGWADQVAFHELAGEDHGPVWLPALSRGMQTFLAQP